MILWLKSALQMGLARGEKADDIVEPDIHGSGDFPHKAGENVYVNTAVS